MKRILTFVLALAISISSDASIRLPQIIGDHMVLQQNTKAGLWGWATPSHSVSVSCSWSGRSYTTKSDAEGRWSVKVETPSAGGPYEITISDGQKLKLTDILIGEVWLCSGQSNMEMPLEGFEYGQYVVGAQDFIANARPQKPLRMAQLALDYSIDPKDDCHTTWQTNDPAILPKISACAAFFGDYLQNALDVPVGLIITDWGASTIEAWMDKESIFGIRPGYDFSILNDPDKVSRCPQQTPTVLFNAMVLPLKDYTVKGLIWYQGESNIPVYQDYALLQKAFIDLWRKTFNCPDMAFCYAQIAPFEYPYAKKEAAFLREQQDMGESIMDNAAMAVTIDLGEQYVIHPRKKMEVAKRMAWGALALAYDRQIEYQSPRYVSHETDGGRIIVHISNAELGLHCTAPDGAIPGFEVAGEDRRFYPAQAALIHRPEEVLAVSSPQVPHPVAVRYCFKDYQPGYLYNSYDLPLAPFRTDDWDDAKGPVFWW